MQTETADGRGVILTCVIDASGRLCEACDGWCRLFGATPDGMAGTALASLLHPEDAAIWRALDGGCAEHGVLRLTPAPGKETPVAWRWVGPTADGARRAVAVALDATERLEADLAELETMAGAGVWSITAADGARRWSRGTFAIYGVPYSAEPMSSEASLACYPEPGQSVLRRALERLRSNSEPYDLELPFVNARGQALWVRVTGRAARRGAAPLRFHGTITDVTAARATRRKLESLSEVARRTVNLVVVCDAAQRVTWVNDAFRAAIGLDANATPGAQFCALFPGVDPDGMARLRTALDAGRALRIEIAATGRDGRRCWLDADIQPTRDLQGALTGHVAVMTDVTARRESERRLGEAMAEVERATARLRAAVEAMPDGFAYYDAQDRLVLCNAQYRSLYPRSAAMMVPGARFEDIVRAGLDRGEYPDAIGREEAWLAQRLAAHRDADGEQELRTADGRWLRIIERATQDGGRVGLRADVTRARQAEQRLADIIRGAEAGTWEWNVATGETAFNARWAEMLGRSLDALGPTTAETFVAFVHPDDRPQIEEALSRHLSGAAEFFHCEMRMRHAAGHWVWVLSRGRLTGRTAEGAPATMYGIHLDVTEQREAEAALAASREQLRALFDALPDGVMVLDAVDRAVTVFNPAAPRLLGHTEAALAGLRPADLAPADGPDAGALAAALARVGETGAEDLETGLRRGDGDVLPVSLSLRALRHGPKPAHLAVFRDVRAALRHREETETARRAAEAASAAKSMFLATMSHEIRTPMNGVMGMAEALARRLEDPEARGMAETIRRSGEALLAILNDILDVSKIEAGRLELEAAPFAPLALAERIEAVHGLRAREKGVAFEVRADLGAARRRVGDSLRVMQILHNLVSNAVKFTSAGAIRLTVKGDAADMLRLSVRDSGLGMSQEQIEQLFEPFRQAEAGTTRRFGGTGLGMSIVKNLTDLMGGTVSVESWPGEGTAVEIALPLPFETAAASTAASTAAATAAAAAAARGLGGLRVLGADDNEINRMVLREMLGALGVAADIVEGGRQAARAAALSTYDALVLDISMPEIDGERALALIRAEAAQAGRPRVPAVAATAHAFPHQIAAYRAAGFDSHVAKPLSIAALRAALEEALGATLAETSGPADG